MDFGNRGERAILRCVHLLVLTVAAVSQQQVSVRLLSQQFITTLYLQPSTAEEAAKLCLTDPSLPGPGVLAPATLLLYVVQEIVSRNTALLQGSLRQDPAAYLTGGTSLWVMDPWGSCRVIILPSRLLSYTGAVELSWVPCSWTLQFVCMEYATAQKLTAGLTLAHNLYRTPNPPPLPPAVPSRGPGFAAEAPPGYRLVHTGIKLGYAKLPDGAQPFTSMDGYRRLGPVVNVIGRWRPMGLDALSLVNAGDTLEAVELALVNANVPHFFGDPSPVDGPIWAANPLPREGVSADELRTSYITRVEGCTSNLAVQRMVIVSAGGAAAAQGVARCLSNFVEEVAPGGFLAAIEGYYIERQALANTTVDPTSVASIVQLWFVWAVPSNYTTEVPGASYATGGVRAVGPRLQPLIPQPQCSEARLIIPAGFGIRGRAECGPLSTERYACPSYMCCGSARGRVGICGTLASSCLLSSCDPSYGLCGAVPFDTKDVTAHEGILGVAPAPSVLSSSPPYTVDMGGPDAEVTTSLVRWGANAYFLDKSASFQYAAALEHCKAQAFLGLSWRLISLTDAFAFEVSVLARTSFLLLLDSRRVVWVQPRPGNTTLGVSGCLTVSWNVDVGSVQLVALQASDCTSAASVICMASWVEPPLNRSLRLARTAESPAPPPDGQSNASSAAVRWTPGVHNLSYNLIGFGKPNSGPSCVFKSYDWFLSSLNESLAGEAVVVPSSSSSTNVAPIPYGISLSLSSPLAGIALRPLLVWSAVSAETPAVYETVGSIAVQYVTADSQSMPPIVLGSLDGTYLSPNASYGAKAPTLVDGTNTSIAMYLSAGAGWRALQLDLSLGEVVVEVSGCRGALLELVVLKTSTGQVWTAPVGPGLSCSVPFRFTAPPGGYLVALQVFAGNYVEEVKLVWGTPLLPPSSAPPEVTRLASEGGSKSSATPPVIYGISIGCVVALLVIVIVALRYLRRRRQRLMRPSAVQFKEGAPATQAAAAFGLSDSGLSRAYLELSSVLVDVGSRPADTLGSPPSDNQHACGNSHSPSDAAISFTATKNSGGGENNGSAAAAAAAAAGDGTACVAAAPGSLAAFNGGPCGRTPAAETPGGDAESGALPLAGTVLNHIGSGNGVIQLAAYGTALAETATAASAASGPTEGSPDAGLRSAPLSGSCFQSNTLEPQPQSTCGLLSEANVRVVTAGRSVGTPSDGGCAGGSSDAECCGGADALAQDIGGGPGPPSGGGPAGEGLSETGGSSLQHPATVSEAAPAPAGLGSSPAAASHAWAQQLHDALLHKFLYQWRPQALGLPLGGHLLQMPGPLAQSGGPPGPTNAAIGVRAAAAENPPAPFYAFEVITGSPPQPPQQQQVNPHQALKPQHQHHQQQHPHPLPRQHPLHPASCTHSPDPGLASPSSLVVPSTPSALEGSASDGFNGGGTSGTVRAPTSASGSLDAGALPVGNQLVVGSQCQANGLSRSTRAASVPSDSQRSSQAAAVPPRGSAGTASMQDTIKSGRGDALRAPAAAAAAAAGSGAGNGGGRGSGGRAPGHAGGEVAGGGGGCGLIPPGAAGGPKAQCGPQDSSGEMLLGRDVIVDTDDPTSYLGHGTSGVVRRGLLRQEDGTWRHVAVKLLNRPDDEAIDVYRRHLKTLLQEITILGSLCHPNIVQLLGGSVSLQPGASFLVEELCGRTLSHAIYDENTPYSLVQVLRWAADIARGLTYLHPNIMHRDLKPSNVLLDHNGTAKISDFGLARFKVHTTLITRDAEVGTTCYMSPECFVSNDFKVTAACDVYSLGVVINELCTRQRPWSGVRTAVVGFKVAVVGARPQPPDEGSPLCPPSLRRLIQDCWAQQPEERPNSAAVLARLQELLAQVEGGDMAPEVVVRPGMDAEAGSGQESRPGSQPGGIVAEAVAASAAAPGGGVAVAVATTAQEDGSSCEDPGNVARATVVLT